jgi:hypothetical protein
MPIEHHITLGAEEHRWAVDLSAAAGAMAWAARDPAALAADLAGMAEYFPHWQLVGALGGRAARCRECGAFQVPVGGAIRCPVCRAPARADGLLWVGHMPVLASPAPGFAPRLCALRAAGFAEVTVGDAAYLLAPLSVAYPAEWPNVEPAVRYAGRWLDALGLPRYSAAHHLVGDGQACLFAWGQWSAQPIHAVLQQRVVNHLLSLVKIAAGAPPHQAFIGRIHHEAWRPEQ